MKQAFWFAYYYANKHLYIDQIVREICAIDDANPDEVHGFLDGKVGWCDDKKKCYYIECLERQISYYKSKIGGADIARTLTDRLNETKG